MHATGIGSSGKFATSNYATDIIICILGANLALKKETPQKEHT